VLLALMLMVTLMIIVAASAATSLAFKIRRDREEEMIHRGAEYSRAIRRYTKKMGRYPLRVEDLENTDGMRFLRKRYKDPITGRDFKLLHMTDLQRIGVGGLSAAPPAPPNASTNPATNLPGQALPAQASVAQEVTQQQPAMEQTATEQTPGAPLADNGVTDQQASAVTGSKNPSPPATSTDDPPQPLSGGVIVGVASASHKETIREFNRKNHYNDWLFFYDPALDRGLEINGPTQLSRPTINVAQQQPPGSQAAQQ